MSIRISIAACLAAAAGALIAADPDEVAYKPKTYAPRKRLDDAAYRPHAFAPSTPSRSVGAPAEAPRSASRWNIFRREKTVEPSEPLHDPSLDSAEKYVQQKHISVPTIKADVRDLPEKKPFDATGKRVADAGFTPAEKPQSKNPLLTPRQGIKLPDPDPVQK
jgi:hypothetical protein